jgi:hypothetical protein
MHPRRRFRLLGSVGLGALVLGAALGGTTASGGPSGARWGAAFAAAPGAAAQAADDGASTDLRGRSVLELFDQGTDDNTFVDTGSSGFSPGDYIVFRDNLLTADQSQQVGDLNVTCMFLFDVANCHGTATLKGRGKLTFEGTSPTSDRPFLLAITGGTREFQTARGQIRVAPVSGTENANVSVELAR